MNDDVDHDQNDEIKHNPKINSSYSCRFNINIDHNTSACVDSEMQNQLMSTDPNLEPCCRSLMWVQLVNMSESRNSVFTVYSRVFYLKKK